MQPGRRRFLRLTATAALLPPFLRLASAQSYPAGPARIVVGFAPGGSTDVYARLISKWLADRFGQPFTTENRPGAGTNIATEAVVRSAPDGQTLLLVTVANAINATLYQKLNFNFIRDIRPVAPIARQPEVIVVNPSFPAMTVSELIAYAKANPGKITMASSGNGSPSHISGELFKMMAGVDIVHVPYRGATPALTDLLGGQTQLFFPGLAAAIEYIKNGQLRALAVTTAARWEALPSLPTVGEFLPGYESSVWFGIGAPKNTSPVIIDTLNASINAGLADPKMKAAFARWGGIELAGSPADFGQLIATETEKWAKVIKFSGAKV